MDSEFYRSPALRPELAEIVVTLPTFRRPTQLRDTLQSLASQTTGRPLAVIVVENDAEGLAGAEAARGFLADSRLAGLVIVARQRGNCFAYNAGWRTALDTFPAFTDLAVIDDDEVAVPDWLENLFRTKAALGVDIVGGPQLPLFDAAAGKRWARHPVFIPHYSTTGTVPILYSSGNVMIARRVLETTNEPWLDPAFNFIGGGDADFYSRCRAQGFRFGWCAEAPVHETVPARRTERSWVRARSLRNGAISTMIEHRRRQGALGRAYTVAKSLALLAASPARALALGLSTRSAAAGLYHVNVAVGRLMAEVGWIHEQYRNPEAN